MKPRKKIALPPTLPPFFSACQKASLEQITFFFENGQRPDCTPLTVPPYQGWTPLTVALHRGDLAIAQYLMDQGLDFLALTNEVELNQILTSTLLPKAEISKVLKAQLEISALTLLWYRSNTCVIPATWHWRAVKGYSYLIVAPQSIAGYEFYKAFFAAGGIGMLEDSKQLTQGKIPTLYILRPAVIQFAKAEEAAIKNYKERGEHNQLSHKFNNIFYEFLGEDNYSILGGNLVFACQDPFDSLFKPLLRLPRVKSLGHSYYSIAMSDILGDTPTDMLACLEKIQINAAIATLYHGMREIFPSIEIHENEDDHFTFTCRRIPDIQQRLSRLLGFSTNGWPASAFTALNDKAIHSFFIELIGLRIEAGDVIDAALMASLVSADELDIIKQALARKPAASEVNYATSHPWMGDMNRLTLTDVAAMGNQTECVKLLVAENERAPESSRVPFSELVSLPTLSHVVGRNNVELIELFLSKGALSIVPPRGVNPPAISLMMAAVEADAFEVGKCLLRQGAIFHLALESGQYKGVSPLQLAHNLKRTNFIDLFQQAEAATQKPSPQKFGVLDFLRCTQPHRGGVGRLFQPRVLPSRVPLSQNLSAEQQFTYQLASLQGLVSWYGRLDSLRATEQADVFHAVLGLRLLQIYGLMQQYGLDASSAKRLIDIMLHHRPTAARVFSEYHCFLAPRLVPLLQTYCLGKNSEAAIELRESPLLLVHTPETDLTTFITQKLALLHRSGCQLNHKNSSISDVPDFLITVLSSHDIDFEKRAPSVVYQVQAMAACIIQLGALASQAELDACHTVPAEIKQFIQLCQGPRQLFSQEIHGHDMPKTKPAKAATLLELTDKASALFTAQCLCEEMREELIVPPSLSPLPH